MNSCPVLKCRATTPVILKLLQWGNTVVPQAPLWEVRLHRPPPNLHVGMAPYDLDSLLMVPALRLPEEPQFPGEIPAPWDIVGAWQPCPVCGAALLWDEVGHVPGARRCLGTPSHRLILLADGRAQ